MSLKVDITTWVVGHWVGMWMVMPLCCKLPLNGIMFCALAGTWGKQLCRITFWHCHKAQVRLGFQPAQVRENWGAASICSLNVNFHIFQRNKKVSTLIQSACCLSRWFINFRADLQPRKYCVCWPQEPATSSSSCSWIHRFCFFKVFETWWTCKSSLTNLTVLHPWPDSAEDFTGWSPSEGYYTLRPPTRCSAPCST